jgi:hypothetical protein
MAKMGKKPLLTFNALFHEWMPSPSYLGSSFVIEGASKFWGGKPAFPSAMLRRNFPQAKTNTRLKIEFYPWEVDVGRTIWFRDYRPNGHLNYTFSRRGKLVASEIPMPLQMFLRKNLGIKNGDTLKLKIVVTPI